MLSNKFSVSRRMRNIPDPNSSNTPDAVMLCSTFVGSFFPPLRGVPYEAMSGWSSKASEAELKGVDGGD
jgi:hypothetical protein